MSQFVIDPPPVTALPVEGTNSLFPVRRVYCIGRNYAAHTIEMGGNPDREQPFFFMKNPNNMDPSNEFPYPPKTQDVHHEVEMAVMLKSGGNNISLNEALDHVYGYAVSIDMTRRDLQAQAKETRKPWELSKAFERSAPVGVIHPASQVGHLDNGRIELKVNGEERQEGDLNQMIWKVPEMISVLSEFYELAAGDIILSGTPSGVGAINKGDIMEAHIDGITGISITVV